ncbi:MAG: rhodanese-related sulfurtransferase [Acidimicrobiales bacterium]
MNLQKVILYYGFTPVEDPEAIRLWQETLCRNLGLKGRILISKHGINGTLGGDMSALKRYVRQTKSYSGFRTVDFKWSDGTGDDFPRLRVRVRDEVVSFGAADEIKVDVDGIVGGGIRLTPVQVHELVATRGDDVVFFDARNAFETRIGRFKNAVVPDVETTRDFVREIDNGKFDHLKSRPVVTYCTGGIRCEVLSSLMRSRGFEEVYQLQGGIVRYGQEFGDQGLWEGSLYLFDARMNQEFSKESKVLGACEHCEAPTSKYYNCSNLACRTLTLLCTTCAANDQGAVCLHGQRAGDELRVL